ncbi:hypothetical protein TTRE_0000009101 [Trichuris trichiura]|uniref:Uncharacterized protein n=1 Tax=Trichuris trichiura TaxID=36087 RepID=A0A077YUR7_TRITR|nr:hypothetical protein TTRE_0000009101 [Trichuris trichiura]
MLTGATGLSITMTSLSVQQTSLLDNSIHRSQDQTRGTS